jgi:glyoxylase I family protein
MTAPTAAPTQGIQMQTTGIHHVALRTTDLARAKVFYTERLGFPLLMEAQGLFIFGAGATAIGVRGPENRTQADDAFDPYRVGLDHLALACTDAAELRRVADALSASGIQNTGVKTDQTLGKEYVAFKDPDGVAWEFYLA